MCGYSAMSGSPPADHYRCKLLAQELAAGALMVDYNRRPFSPCSSQQHRRLHRIYRDDRILRDDALGRCALLAAHSCGLGRSATELTSGGQMGSVTSTCSEIALAVRSRSLLW